MSQGPDVGVSVERGAATAVWRNGSFRNLLLATGTSSIGDWVGLFALIALAETLSGTSRGGALAVSFVMIARVVPTVFIAPIAGVYVDRWDRQRTMIVTDIVRGAVMLGVAFVGNAFQLVMATFLVEVAAALFIPAKDAVVPTIVRRDRLVQANQLALVATYATLPVGALLSAVFISLTERLAGGAAFMARFPDVATFLTGRPEAVPIVLNALSFFGSIWFVRRMQVPDDNRQAYEERAEHTNALADLREGLRFIAEMPLIRALIVGIMAAFLAAGAVIGVGQFFATILNAGEAGFSLLGFVVGTGLVIGIVATGPLAQQFTKERLFAPGVGVAGAALVVAALMPSLVFVAVPALLMGVGAGVAFILGYTILQEYSNDEVRGRIFATFNTAVRVALFAALVLGPLTITVLGVERTGEQIAQGADDPVDDVDDLENLDEDATYPYQIGGVRLTLILAGLIAMGGALWTRSSLREVLGPEGRGPAGSADAAGASPDPDDRRPPGLFVVFEGGEGAGKSTQVRLLRDALVDAGHEVVVTREPGGTPAGEAVREVLLDVRGEMTAHTEALLYAAARAQHTADVLRPALDQDVVVLCDRYIDSSIAYQGVGRDLGTGIVDDLNDWATGSLEPDLTIVLDVPAGVGLARARDVESPDRLESAGREFHEQVNAEFLRLARRDPDRYHIVDGRQDVGEIAAGVLAAVTPWLPGKQQAGSTEGAHDELADAPGREARAAPAPEPGDPPWLSLDDGESVRGRS